MRTIVFLIGVLSSLMPSASAASVLYAVTNSGSLYRSTDAAKTWENLPIGSQLAANGRILAVDPQNSSVLYLAVVAGASKKGDAVSYLLRSADGGATWSQGTLPAAKSIGLIAVDPTSSNILYAGAGNGLFRSTDSGATWGAATLIESITSVSTDPHQPGVVYLGSSVQKIYKSADFGVTWKVLTNNPGLNQGGAILDVEVDPKNSNILYATSDGGDCLLPGNRVENCGLFQSTDAGTTWHWMMAAGAYWFKNVVIDPRNGAIYAGGGNPSGGRATTSELFKSTDGGNTFTQIVKGMGRYGVQVHLDPESPATLYASQANLPGVPDVGPGGGVYVSTDAGANWTLSPVDPGPNDVIYAMAAVEAAVPAPPVITPNGVTSAASFVPGVVSNSWVAIQGTNLAPLTDDWSRSVINGQLPPSLDGVSVTMGGKPAYIYYISRGLVNVIAPDLPSGPVTVIVKTPNGSSDSFSTTVTQIGPAFFLWPGNQPVAVHADGTLAVKNGTFAGTTTISAKPGEIVILFGTGFGPTTPAVPAGVATPSDAVYASGQATVTINGASIIVFGAALTPGSAALFQVSIQIPNTLADGDYPIQVAVGGVQSPSGVVLSIHQ